MTCVRDKLRAFSFEIFSECFQRRKLASRKIHSDDIDSDSIPEFVVDVQLFTISFHGIDFPWSPSIFLRVF